MEPGDQRLAQALDQLEQRTWALPPGCEVTYELESINILRALLRVPREDALRIWYEGFREQQRQACYDLPTAQRAECLEKTLSYRDYQRARQELSESR